MATIVLSAAGMAFGSSIGGSVLGLSAATIGRAVGASVGRRIDERLLGAGSAPVETGRVDRFRLTGASEGAPISRVYGRMRIAGQVIWATKFLEGSETSGGGKGAPSQPQTTTYSYTISLAVALCRGPITRVGRVWADGVEVSPDSLGMIVYKGGTDQQPDPAMEAVEGTGRVPAYRGLAYVVLEDLPLGQFGNRVPQFSFEVFAPSAKRGPTDGEDIAGIVQAVAMIPGSGEYALATTPVFLSRSYGAQEAVNLNTPSGKTDFLTSLDALTDELPECGSVSLVVSWFGDDLRAGACTIRPKIEQDEVDAEALPWRVSGLTRATAPLVPRVDGRPIYGGTHADASVVQAIGALRAVGQEVMFYPFILMDQTGGNALPDPYTGTAGQPPLPWRGRITTALAPGLSGSTDGTAAAAAEVAAFFGTAQGSDFTANGQTIDYTGPEDWGFRRFILHQAHLCALAGGVDAFCIGSEMVALTQIRGPGNSFPAVAALRALAADVRGILGAGTRIGYAADWSEYHGYQPTGTGDKFFHLDPLWADPVIDFIGIDNYMPLSDWRDGQDHLDAQVASSIYDLDYLTANVAGGEGYDWFYASDEERTLQLRTPITDGANAEPWVYRYKDIRNWWQNAHYDRIGGIRQSTPTAWEPRQKPVWFTEAGCAAIDRGTNQPNKFLDPKSSESQLPYFSAGRRDDNIQIQYLRALHRFWADPDENPLSDLYPGRMIDLARTHIWTWDARPFPAFPGNTALWTDGDNYARGHWLNGRTANRPLSSVVADICAGAGVTGIDTSELYGVLRGMRVDDTDTARAVLQPLMLAYGFDAIERDGALVFRTRDGRADGTWLPERLVLDPGRDATQEITRASAPEVTGRVRVTFIEGEGDYEIRAAEAAFPDQAQSTVTQSELALALTGAEGQRVAERWLAEARLARETARFALPPSATFGAGDVIDLGDGPRGGLWRIDNYESTEFRAVDAVRVEPQVYLPPTASDETPLPRSFVPPVPVEALFLDLPLLTGDEVPQAPHVAVAAQPWPGAVALYTSDADEGYAFDRFLPRPSVIGTTLTPLAAARPGLWDRGPALRVQLVRGSLASLAQARVLAGGNVMAIGSGGADPWEVLQFATATLVAPRTYDLTLRLRGQAGTDGVMPDLWPAGSRIALMNGTPEQVALTLAQRNQPRWFRYGPARRAPSDPTYRTRTETFSGVGLRPYSVAHLTTRRTGGDLAVTWIRRTRILGDAWDQTEVPLGETMEVYSVEVRLEGLIVRSETVAAPAWTYTAAQQSADTTTGLAVNVSVAQVSDIYGPGPARSIDVAA